MICIVRLYYLVLLLSSLGCAGKWSKASGLETHSWPVSDAVREGINPLVLDSIHKDITAGRYGLIDHFLVIRHGKIIADHPYSRDYFRLSRQYDTTEHQYNYDHPDWHPYYKGTRLHTLQSITKSITSTLLGMALDRYAIPTVKQNVGPYFSDYGWDTTDRRKNAITLEDLLTMRSGIRWDESSYGETDDCIIMEKEDKWIPYVLNKTMDTLPGQVFVYNSGVSVLLGKMVAKITGQRIDKWAEEVLFKPLMITDYYWKQTPDGEIDTEGGLYLSAHDLAKIGFLFLHEGVWQGQQLVPKAWVKTATSPIVAHTNPKDNRSMGYGYQWWIPKQSQGTTEIFAGLGFGGQYLMVVPEHDLIVVFNAWNHHDRPEKNTFRVLEDHIIPAIIK